jgi:hypothetical protein
MRTRQYVTVAALSTLLTLGLGGCILGANGGGGGSGTDTEAGTGDVGPDSPEDAVSDTGVDGSDVDDSECTGDDQCTNGPDNMTGTCTDDGTCDWTCQTDFVDEDGDRSNGCECETSDQSSYVVDSDDDGFPEEGGTSESFCSPPSEANWVDADKEADCEDDDPDINPGLPDDEKWMCDGVDNNCRDGADEACCSDKRPKAVGIGEDDADQIAPRIVRPLPGAPKDAEWLVIWAEGKQVKLQHVDQAGSAVGKISSRDTGLEVLGLEAVRGPKHYVVAVAVDQGINGEAANLLRFDASLQKGAADISSLDKGADVDLSSLTVSADGIWLAYSLEVSVPVGTHYVKVVGVQLSRKKTVGPLVVSDRNEHLPAPGAPEVAVTGKTPVVAWWDADKELVRGAIISSEKVQGRFKKAVDVVSRREAEPIDLISTANGIGVVYPDYAQSKGVLKLIKVEISGNSGRVGAATQLTDGSKDNRLPTVRRVDADRDEKPDELLVAWGLGLGDDPTLVAGQTDLKNLGMLDPAELVGGVEAGRPSLVSADGHAGVVWPEFIEGNDRDVSFAPLSVDGVPICKPSL